MYCPCNVESGHYCCYSFSPPLDFFLSLSLLLSLPACYLCLMILITLFFNWSAQVVSASPPGYIKTYLYIASGPISNSN